MKARQAKKYLKAISVMHLEPGDTVVLSLDHYARPEIIRPIREQLVALFPRQRVLVLDAGLTLSAVRAEPSTEAA